MTQWEAYIGLDTDNRHTKQTRDDEDEADEQERT